ncbi:uncharacterized protein L3040_009058 [Drepanopeziza brunnea f. sp. 'multigermtubi']|uniref:uncharacterized protein n=1 Tax=Drepanopeziza brunnea f. sp. 'multigermtubi' TaxID=698441 RepID=UPI00238C20FF|nr:hypothetical protein L3040_009058 [Drepanopeziza brunnea f. sp. 'multigermtubi']
MDQFQDRQDVQIWNAIEAKNYKQALKLVDKRLAKKRTDYHELFSSLTTTKALKIYIRALSPQVSEKSAVLQHLEELAERKKAFLDSTILDCYDDALEKVLSNPREHWAKIIGEMRWQSVKASPKNEDTSIECFHRCLSMNDLDHARQIANSLEKNFPKTRDYVFWNISTMFLFSIQPSCPEMQRKIWGGLAFGTITKLATATKQATDQQKLPLRAIQTPQELLLLQRITQTCGKIEQRLEYLQDPLLGPESVVAKGEWELWRLKLELLEKAQEWKELFEVTGSLLKRSRTKNEAGNYSEARLGDWVVWEAYVLSAGQLKDRKATSQTWIEVKAHLDPECGIDKSWKRNASLALVKITFESSSPFSETTQENGGLPHRVTASIGYLQNYASASTAYNDLRPFIGKMSQEERKQFIGALDKDTLFENGEKSQSLATARQITESINMTKLKYLLKCSLPEHDRTQSPKKRDGNTEFTSQESIASYRSAINDDGRITKDLLSTDRHPADDFAVLAATTLIRIALVSSDTGSEPLKTTRSSYLLQATVLLEKAWTHSKSNFQISLVLVRLYIYLGCGSLAMRSFQRLALKQVQLDTLSYILFDRISSFHPHPFTHYPDGMAKSITPIEQLRKHQKLYKSAQEHVVKNVSLSFKHNSYNSIFEIKEVEETLSKSLARVMSVIESRKVARLMEPKTSLTEISQRFDILVPSTEEPATLFADTNDYSTFPNYESASGPSFEELSRFVPAPSNTRYRLALATSKLALITSPSTSSGEAALLQQWLKQYLATPTPKMGAKDLTVAETLAQASYDALAHVLHTAYDKELNVEPDVKGRLDGWNSDLVQALEKQLKFVHEMEGVAPPLQSTLHALYTSHEVGTAALSFSAFISRQGKNIVYEKQAEASQLVKEVAEKLLAAVEEKCRGVKRAVDEGGWIDRVLECVVPDEGGVSKDVVKELKGLVDENFMEAWAGEVVESWKDSVVGLALLKGGSAASVS